MRKLLLLFLVFAAGVLLAGAAVLWRGVGTRHAPGVIETRIARTLRRISIGAAVRARTNPVVPTPQVIADARGHWADHCAICHANNGSGNTEIGRNLYPRSPDMRAAETQKLSDGELFTIIRDGVRLTGMPGWSGDDEENWKLVHFVRRLPHLTPEEIEAMERLNRKSPAEYEEMRREEEFLRGQ